MPVLAVLVLRVVVFILGKKFLVELFLFWDGGSSVLWRTPQKTNLQL